MDNSIIIFEHTAEKSKVNLHNILFTFACFLVLFRLDYLTRCLIEKYNFKNLFLLYLYTIYTIANYFPDRPSVKSTVSNQISDLLNLAWSN